LWLGSPAVVSLRCIAVEFSMNATPLDAGLAKSDYRFELKIISIFVFDFTPFYAMVYIFQFGTVQRAASELEVSCVTGLPARTENVRAAFFCAGGF